MVRESVDQCASRVTAGAFDLNDHSTQKSAHEPLGETLDLVRMGIGCQNDPGTAQMDGIQGVQEFSLRLGLVAQEMNVVNGQQRQASHRSSEFINLVFPDGCDVFVGELFACQIADRILATKLFPVSSADTLKKMGLAQATSSMDEKGGCGACSSLCGNPGGGRPGELIAGANHEILELVMIGERSFSGPLGSSFFRSRGKCG